MLDHNKLRAFELLDEVANFESHWCSSNKNTNSLLAYSLNNLSSYNNILYTKHQYGVS